MAENSATPTTSADPKKTLWALFSIMLKLGAFTFGGGYTIVPLMQRDFVDKRGWIDSAEMVDIVAVSQSIPGAIAVNASIFIGYRVRGVAGALVSVLGTVLPSLISLAVISFFYTIFIENRVVLAVLSGIRASVVALMVQAVIKLGKPSIKDWYGAGIAVLAFALAILLDMHVVLLILGGGLVGLAIHLLRGKKVRG